MFENRKKRGRERKSERERQTDKEKIRVSLVGEKSKKIAGGVVRVKEREGGRENQRQKDREKHIWLAIDK